MKRFFYLMVLLLLFSAGLQSCGDDFAPIENSETLTAATDTSTAKPRVVLTREERVLLDEWANKTPKLSKEQAAEIADNFFGNESSVSTLSKFGSFAPQCEVLVRSKHKLSKSNDGHELLDTMLYVFNYDDGYAVVSADLRTPAPILAYSDEGSIHLDSDNPGINLFLDMAQDYIDYYISRAELIRDSIEKNLISKLSDGLELPIDSITILSKKLQPTSDNFHIINMARYTKYRSSHKIGPYIRTAWHQNRPYNNVVSEKQGEVCPAGCQSIGIAQLMAYWKCPLFVNGEKINWNSILYEDDNFETSVAKLVYNVGYAMNTQYSPSGSNSTTDEAIALLKKSGYVMNELSGYSFDGAGGIKESIDLKRPVVIRGETHVVNAKGNKDKVGHLWLVDGYAKIIYDRELVITYAKILKDRDGNDDDIVVRTSTTTIEQYFQHFNLGWGVDKKSNKGYYIPGVFDINNGEYVIDAAHEPHKTTSPTYKNDGDYRYYVNIITNIHP